MPARRLGLALLAAVALGGCGDDEEAGSSAAAGTIPSPGGTLRIAVEGQIKTLDPLLARTRAERLAARQVHEPLISTQNGPFGQARRRPGLVRSIDPRAGGRIWTAQLRPGIRFGDGERMDADAVLANGERWIGFAAGPAPIPELTAVDSPRPGLVRFLLDRPEPRFPRELARAELGIVAPVALAAAGSGPVPGGGTGTGPFELREREAGRTLLARNASWWGTRLGLGPGVDQIELLSVDEADERSDQLAAGSLEAADQLDPVMARTVEADALLRIVRGGGAILGLERSVRGIESAEPDQALADVWLTDLR